MTINTRTKLSIPSWVVGALRAILAAKPATMSQSYAFPMRSPEDTIGRHDTVYGCCSNQNNMLRYNVETSESCYDNFSRELAKYDMGLESIVPNINWFMSVPVLADGSAGVSNVELKPGSYVKLRAECNVLAVLSNCPQMHNPCNGFNPTPIEVSVH